MSAERVYLSGQGPSEAIEWEFYCSSGRKSGEWAKIPVPSNWEQHGFGGYDYGHVPPNEKHDEVGTYRTSFMVPKEWENRHVRLVFEGALTETSIKVNGRPIGTAHQGGYLPFSFQLDGNTFRSGQRSPVLKYGEDNELEVVVAKKPSNLSLDLAERKGDYWVFGGIYRPVYLEVLPKDFIHRIAIDAAADGQLMVDAFLQHHEDIKTKHRSKLDLVDGVEVQVLTLDGVAVGSAAERSIPGPVNRARLEARIENIDTWTPESPNLYQLRTRLLKGDEVVHERLDTFGFRTIELRPGDGLYLNGVRILVKGVNRNGLHADTARAIDPEEAWNDARLIKAMNANLVRSHQPPTKAFMEACDRLGLLFMTELTTWQKPAMDTPIARNLVHELVTTYHNHPSYIMWANGNEGGFNKEVDELYSLYDLQDRPVIHPWALFDGVDAMHYPSYSHLDKALQRPFVLLPTEFLHGLYDGGVGAGLADYWNLIEKSPVAAGAVLWCWGDAGVARSDKGGLIDTDGNYSADGIVGPRREKEASYFTIREIWSPLQIPLQEILSGFDGTLPVENKYFFSTLEGAGLEWKLMRYSNAGQAKMQVSAEGEVPLPAIPPQEKGKVGLPLPKDWQDNDVLVVRANHANGDELMQWSWPLRVDFVETKQASTAPIEETGSMRFLAGGVTWVFDPETGHLIDCLIEGNVTGLGKGPVLYAGTAQSVIEQKGQWTVGTKWVEDSVVISSSQAGSGSTFSWTLQPDGSATLDYDFAPVKDALTYCAVGFDLPEGKVAAKRWLGDGPYRIWANRRQGPQFGLWENRYNDTIPGVTWDYPAFKGVFANVDWMAVSLTSGAELRMDPHGLAEVGVLRPANEPVIKRSKGGSGGPIKATWDYPESGGLFLFHKVPAVGTKFKRSSDLGPQAEPQRVAGHITGTLTFSVQAP
ncbi:MAG: glycoside hydrolase family 2 TIM barrel-domain containing protein [Coraliomargarita sp.]